MSFMSARNKASRKIHRYHRPRSHRPFFEMDRLEPRVMLSGTDLVTGYQVPQYYLMQSNSYLTAARVGDSLDIARDYLMAHAGDLGLTVQDVLAAAVTARYTDSDTGLTHIYFEQQVNQLNVQNTALTVTVTADGRILNVAGGFYPNAAAGAPAQTDAPLTADVAAQGASSLGLTAGNTLLVSTAGTADHWTVLSDSQLSLDPIDARLAYLPTPYGLRLVWDMPLRTPDNQHWYDLSVDAYTGTALQSYDWVDHATYNVFPIPVEAPNDGSRAVLTDPYDPAASPYGWQDTNGVPGAEYTDTRGNNVFAQEDVDANNTGGFRPDGGAALNFNFPLDLTQSPSAYQPAAITNLFYWNNLCHDLHEKYGFTEAAGNFQVDNYTGLGLGNDPVQADAQDGSGTNNANFATPPDGQSPRMQMYIFTYTSPYRDGDLDSEIMVHEYGHGVSNRLTGGPANSNALNAIQSGGMGEGWSDWWATMFTQNPTDTQNAAYPTGTYVLGQSTSGAGIRRYPYSYNMALDPETINYYNTDSSHEVHNTGEIWCTVLWDLNWLLINKYGYSSNIAQGYTGAGSAGNVLALKLVMDALKIQPANPSFKDARDAILQADQVLTGGANAYEIWSAFARRGMGASFVDSSSGATSVTPAYDLPATFLAPSVTGQSPAGVSTVPVSTLDLTFTLAMNPASFDVASDVVSFTSPTGVDLKPTITGYSWINSNQTLRLNFAPTSEDGVYTLVIGPQILSTTGKLMDQNHNGIAGEPGDAYSANFRYDSLVGQVINTIPAPLSVVELPMTTLDLVFNENITGSSVDTTDLTVSQGAVVGATQVAPNTARYTLSGVNSEGTLNVTLAPGAVTDTYGNPEAGYSTSYALDAAVTPFPTPMAGQSPTGSLIYNTSAAATITVADTDAFTLLVNPGQTITVLVKPTTSTLMPQVQLLDPNNAVIGSAVAAAAGQYALIQAVPTANVSAGTFTVVVSGAGGATGGYTVQLTLNAALEGENYVSGTSNDTLGTAQDISASFITLTTGSNQQRGAVLGTAQGGTGGNLVVNGGFESGSFSGWTTATTGTPYAPWSVSLAGAGNSTGYGILVTAPVEGNYDSWNGFDGSGPMQYTMTQDVTLPASSGLSLTWQDRLQWNFTVASGSALARGLYLDVLNPTTNAVLATPYSFSTGPETTNPTGNTGWVAHSVDLSAFAGTTVRLRFREEIPEASSGPGQAEFDAIALNSNVSANVDYYRFAMNGGDTATVAVNGQSAGNLFLELRDATDAVLATGVSAANLSKVISNFTAATTANYYVRVTSDSIVPYSLVVTRNAAFDTENNNTSATAQSLDQAPAVLGSINFIPGTANTIDFTELSARPVNGVSLKGLTFGFTVGGVASTDATFGGGGPGTTLYTTPPQLEGNAGGQLTLTFASPTTTFRFPLVLSTTGTVPNAGTFKLYDAANNLITTTSITTTVPAGYIYTEGLFNYTGTTPIKLAVITFYSNAGRFVTDNITYGSAPSADADWYSVTANSTSSLLQFYTSTPSDGPGQFGNTFNPHIELYSPSGTLLASGTALPDGRNEAIQYMPTTTGVYRVRVIADGTSTGEYVLSLAPPGLSIVASTPGANATLSTPPSAYVLQFSDQIDPATLQPGDLLVNAIPADSVSLSADGRTATFSYSASPVTTQGLQTMVMPAGAVAKLSDPSSTLNAYSVSFRFDAISLQVTSTLPASGDSFMLPGPFTFDVTFNEPVDPASVQASDLVLSGMAGATVTGVSVLPGNTTARFTLDGISSEGSLNATIAGGAINDAFGNPGQPFTGTYGVDFGTRAYPTPLQAINPLGSMIYDPTITGVIGIAGDTDAFTISLDAGQTATVLVTPSAGLQPTVQFLDPTATLLGSAMATAAGQPALLQTLTAASAGTYTIIVGGAAGGTGAYTVQLVLNAAQETEGVLQGVSNGTLATAQDLDSSWTSLGGAAARTAVLGTIATSIDVDYYRFTLQAGDTLSMALKNLSASLISAQLFNASGTLLANAPAGATNVDRLFTDFIAAASGSYYIAVSGSNGAIYALVLSRNADFDTEANDTITQAQDVLSRQVGGDQYAFGYVGAAGDAADIYRVNVAAGGVLTLQTSTPGDGPGEFVNSLIPRLRLLDAAGNPVAENVNGAPDGRNALLSFANTGPSATYFVEVSSSTAAATQGEYVLRLNGNSAAPPAFQVSAVTPANGAAFRIAPTSVTIDFNNTIQLSSVAASDLKIDGISATAVTVVDADTLTFTIPAATVSGTHTLTINAGDVFDIQGAPLAAFTSAFLLDVTGPRVLSMSPAPGTMVPTGAVSIQVTFNEAMAAGNLSSDDFSLAGAFSGVTYTASSYSFNPGGTMATFNYAGLPEDSYTFTLVAGVSGGTNFTDVLGNALDGEFSGTFPSGNGTPGGNFVAILATDIVSAAFPTPLTAQAPMGSLIYSGTTSGIIGISSDSDPFTINLDAGQKVSVIVHPVTTTLRPAVTIAGPDTLVLGSATAAAANQEAVVQTITAASAGTYTIAVSSDGLTTGMYTLQLVLNSAVEAEQHGGPTNDTLATAQNLDAAGVSLPGGVSIASVLGTLAAGATDYYGLTLTAGQPVSIVMGRLSGSATPALTLVDALGNPVAIAHNGAANVMSSLDGVIVPAAGTYGLKLTATGSVDYSLSVIGNGAFDLESNDTLATSQALGINQSVVGAITGGGTPGGGIKMGLIQDSSPWGSTSNNTVAAGLGYVVTTIPSSALATANFAGYDMIVLAGDQSSTTYANVQTNIARIESFVASGGVWIVNYAAGNVSLPYSYDVLPGAAGTSFAGFTGTDINVLAPSSLLMNGPGGVITSTTLDGGNYSYHGYCATTLPTGAIADLSTAVSSQIVAFDYPYSLGHVVIHAIPVEYYQGTGNFGIFQKNLFNFGASFKSSNEDDYIINVTAGVPVQLRTSTPGDGIGEFVNTLNPMLELYDSSGSKVASDDDSAPDGRNALLNFTPTYTGVYFAKVKSSAASATAGEYVLNISGVTPVAAPLTVTAITPADGASLIVAPTAATLTFSSPILLTTLQAGDLRLDGVPVSGVTITGDHTAVFTLPAMANGTHTLSIDAGDVKDIHNNALGAFASSFTLDTTPPHINASSIQAGDVRTPGPLTLTVTFSRPMLASNLDATDFSLHGNVFNVNYTAASFAYGAGNTVLTLTYANLPEDSYTATLLSGVGRFADTNGVNLDGEYSGTFPTGDGAAGGNFVVNFSLDQAPSAFPALTMVAPGGGLVYSGATTGVLGTPTDTDAFTVNLQANQQLTVLMRPLTTALRPAIVLTGPSGGTLASNVAAAANMEGVIQTFLAPSTGTYTVTVSSAVATIGQYSLQLLVNSAVESEEHGGSADDNPAAAQNLDGGFVALDGGGSRAAVVGSLNGGTLAPTNTGTVFSGARDFVGTPLSIGIANDGSFVGPTIGARLNSTEFLRYGVYLAGFTVAMNGASYTNDIAAGGSTAFPVTLEDISTGTMHGVRATGTINSMLGFQRTVWWYDGDSYALVSTTLTNKSAMAISTVALLDNQDPDPGGNSATANDVIVDSYGQFVCGAYSGVGAMALASLDSRAVASAEGFEITDPFEVINSPVDPNGASDDIAINLAFNIGTLAANQSTTATMAMVFGATQAAVQSKYDAIAAGTVGTGTTDDYYSVSLIAGQSLSAAATRLGSGNSSLRLYNSGNSLLATGITTATNVSNAIDGYTVPATGTYYLRVSGGGTDYSLVVLKNAAFDLEPNDSTAAPQPLGTRTSVLGYVPGASNTDYYSFVANANDSILLRTYTPGGIAGMAVSNALDPAVELYDPTGTLVASDDNSAADARNAGLAYTASLSGTYVVRVRPSTVGATSGEYVLESHVSSVGQMLGRSIFYQGSSFDAGNDDLAVAPDKTALLPGQTASFANYTSYLPGINGIMFDINQPAASLNASEFSFKVGGASPSDLDPAAWAAAPAPKSVIFRPGAGVSGSTRVEVLWDDHQIQNQWLQVTILADANTRLAANDVFYFGNAVGEVGDSSSDAHVTSADELATRLNVTSFLAPAALGNRYDFNRDGRVDAFDELVVRARHTDFSNALQLITVPSYAPAESASASSSFAAESASPASSSDFASSASLAPAAQTSAFEATTSAAAVSPAASSSDVVTVSVSQVITVAPSVQRSSSAITSSNAKPIAWSDMAFSSVSGLGTLKRRATTLSAALVHIPSSRAEALPLRRGLSELQSRDASTASRPSRKSASSFVLRHDEPLRLVSTLASEEAGV